MICKSKNGIKYIAGIYNKCFGREIKDLKCYFQSIETLRRWINREKNRLENRQGEQRVNIKLRIISFKVFLNNMLKKSSYSFLFHNLLYFVYP